MDDREIDIMSRVAGKMLDNATSYVASVEDQRPDKDMLIAQHVKIQLAILKYNTEHTQNSGSAKSHVVSLSESQLTPPGDASKLHSNPPSNYVCFRCGIPGHYVQQCPTINKS